MKRFFKMYSFQLLRLVALGILPSVIMTWLLKGFPSKAPDIGSLTPIIGFLLIMAAIMTVLALIPDFIRMMNEKTQRDIDEYKRLKHISQEQKINKH